MAWFLRGETTVTMVSFRTGFGEVETSASWSMVSIPAPPVVKALIPAPAFLRGPARLQCVVFASPAPDSVVRKGTLTPLTHQS